MGTRRNRTDPERDNRRSIPAELAAEEESLAEELLRVSREEQAVFVAGWERLLKQLGIRGKPIRARKLRERLLKRGFNPESNEFSQGIIAMREE